MGAAVPMPRDAAMPEEASPNLLLALARFLERAEGEAARSAGAFVLQQETGDPADRRQLGTVMVEEGRLCWATAEGSSYRLSLLIGRETGLSLDELRALFARCREEGKPFGELLVERGLVAAETLRRLLLEQIAHALGALVRECRQLPCSWSSLIPASARTYHPRFTFCSGEVVCGVLQHDLEIRVQQPPVPTPFLSLLSEPDVRGACLQEVEAGGEEVVPVVMTADFHLTLEDSRTLLRSTRHLLGQPALRPEGEVPHLAFLREERSGMVVARSGRHHLVAEVDDRSGFAALVAGLRELGAQDER